MSQRFNPAPGWPEPPRGWTPPSDWKPDPSWPPLPPDWPLWIKDDDQASYGVAGQRENENTKPQKGDFLRGLIGMAVITIVVVGGITVFSIFSNSSKSFEEKSGSNSGQSNETPAEQYTRWKSTEENVITSFRNDYPDINIGDGYAIYDYSLDVCQAFRSGSTFPEVTLNVLGDENIVVSNAIIDEATKTTCPELKSVAENSL